MRPYITTRWSLCLILIACLFLLTTHAETASLNVSAWTSSHPGGPGDLSGTYQPLKGNGLLAAMSTSSDFSNSSVTTSADAAVFGSDSSSTICTVCEGRGIEPMAYAIAEAVYHDNRYFIYEPALAVASIKIFHRIKLTDDAPPGDWQTAIPMFVDYRLYTGGKFGALTDASLSVAAPGLPIVFTKSAANGEAFSGTLSFNSSAFDYISIAASADVNALYQDVWNSGLGRTERIGGSGQAIADPFLFVDPNWEYARYVVVEQESFLFSGEWKELTRGWMYFCECDLEPDGDVDGKNLYSFISDFGRTDCTEGCQGDLDGDGDVDIADLELFAIDFGKANCK
jgi:hypothetical protein